MGEGRSGAGWRGMGSGEEGRGGVGVRLDDVRWAWWGGAEMRDLDGMGVGMEMIGGVEMR